jgi:hypothetical protein
MRFPEFVEQQGGKGHVRVFPELIRINTNFGHKFGERFSGFKKTVELELAAHAGRVGGGGLRLRPERSGRGARYE